MIGNHCCDSTDLVTLPEVSIQWKLHMGKLLLVTFRDMQMEGTNFTVVREVISQSHWSLPLLGIKPKKFDFVHYTASRQEVHTGWAQDYSLVLYAGLP